MNKVAMNPGCRHECRLDRSVKAGFVIEVGCPAHDREGYRPFSVVWLGPRPCLVSTLTLGYYEAPPDAPHEHVHVFSSCSGLN